MEIAAVLPVVAIVQVPVEDEYSRRLRQLQGAWAQLQTLEMLARMNKARLVRKLARTRKRRTVEAKKMRSVDVLLLLSNDRSAQSKAIRRKFRRKRVQLHTEVLRLNIGIRHFGKTLNGIQDLINEIKDTRVKLDEWFREHGL